MNKLITVAIAVLSLTTAVSARAQITVNFGDLVLGFRNTSGQGTSLNLEVDLGSYTNFLNASGPLTLSGPNGLAAQDLVDTYGASWNTNSSLFWSVGSTSGSSSGIGLPDNTLFVTSTGTVFKRQTGAQQQTMSDNITLFNQSLNGVTPTAHSTKSSVIDATGSSSYTGGITGNGTFGRPYNANSPSLLSFATVENTTNIPTAPGSFVSLSLEELVPTASGTANGSILGSFRLFADGTLQFIPTAVPEPSSLAMLLLGGLGSMALVWRRRVSKP